MLDCIRVKKGSSQRLIAVFVDVAGAGKTGLIVSVRVLRASDGKYLADDASWNVSPTSEPTAAEVSATHNPGVYEYEFAMPDALDQYLIRMDGTAAAANRYVYGRIEAVATGDADLHKVRAALVNRQTQSIADGVVTIMDDDGVTPLVTLTPSVDDPDNASENILTPS
jgi:hypothetical protein